MGIETDCRNIMFVPNGGFDDASFWRVRPNWTIAAGVANTLENGVPDDGYLSQPLIGQANHTYRIKFTITNANLSPGNLFVIRVFSGFATITANGNYTLYITITSPTPVFFDGLWFFLQFSGFIGDSLTLDNVEMIDITQQILCVYGFDPRIHSKYELLDLGGGFYNLRLAHRIDGSNVLMRFIANLF